MTSVEVREGAITRAHVLPAIGGDRIGRAVSAEGYLRIEIEEDIS